RDVFLPSSVHRTQPVIEHEILHPQIGAFLARLTEQHHQHDPFDLLDVYFTRIEREQAIDDELALIRIQDSDALEVQEVAATSGIEARLLARIEDSDRTRGWDLSSVLRVDGQLLEPVEGTLDVLLIEPGELQLLFERIATRLGRRLEVGVEVVLEKIDENIENAVLHFAAMSLFSWTNGRRARLGRIRCGFRALESTASKPPRRP